MNSIVGDLINFRGLVYAPMNENGVILLFGKITEDLNMYVEEIKPGFPDCIARRFSGKGWERVRVEFEFQSLNFKQHKHDPEDCDLIICWEDNWSECPLDVLSLKEIIPTLENRPVTRPDSSQADAEIEWNYTPTKNLLDLAQDLTGMLKSFSEDIFRKKTKLGYTFYSPERVFVYLFWRKTGIRLMIFTGGESWEGVIPAESGTLKVGGQKWGYITIKNDSDLKGFKNILHNSWKEITNALMRKEPTGYYALSNDENQE